LFDEIGEACDLKCVLKVAGSMRVEILNGVERRRRWSDDEKARIIEETFAPGVKVSDVARKHGVSRNLIFAWRRQARPAKLGEPTAARLIPIHVAAPRPPALVMQAPLAQKPPHSARAPKAAQKLRPSNPLCFCQRQARRSRICLYGQP
jgi:transposase